PRAAKRMARDAESLRGRRALLRHGQSHGACTRSRSERPEERLRPRISLSWTADDAAPHRSREQQRRFPDRLVRLRGLLRNPPMARMRRPVHLVLVCLVVLAWALATAVVMPAATSGRRFYPDDPIA